MTSKEEQTKIKSIRRLAQFLRVEKITFDEFASNAIESLVGVDSDIISACIALLSTDEQQRLLNYAIDYYAANGFAPHPFMADYRDPDAVERKREEMRPKHEQLLKDIKNCIVT